MIKTIATLKLRQAERALIRIEDLAQMRDNYSQIVLVLEKQREKYKEKVNPSIDLNFQMQILKSFEQLFDYLFFFIDNNYGSFKKNNKFLFLLIFSD